MKICIFADSSDSLPEIYFSEAEKLGRLIAENSHTLIFGGGRGGLMGACARGTVSRGGKVMGIAPRFFDEPGILYKEAGEFIFTDTMAQRKALMEEKADSFILLPGGIGSFEEFFETLTLKQLGRLRKPIVILNTAGYYDKLIGLLRHTASEGFMSKSCLGLYRLCSAPEEALEKAVRPEDTEGSIRRLSDYGK